MHNLELIQLIMKAKENDVWSQEKLLNKFEPLILKYASKLYNMEFEDAKQELSVGILLCIRAIKRYSNNYECLGYIKVYMYRLFCKLYQSSKPKNFEEVLLNEDITSDMNHQYRDIVELTDLEAQIKNLSKKKQKIIYLSYIGYSDKEISKVLEVSRQYVNRIKKQIFNNLKN